MSYDLIVITFDSEDGANNALDTIKSLKHEQFMRLEDTAVVVKNAEGEVKSHNAVDTTTKHGIAGGGLIGLFIGALFGGPIGAMLFGGVAGGLVGMLVKNGVSSDFIKDVSEELQPETSALFIVVRDARADVTLAALRQNVTGGKVLQTTLPKEVEVSLQKAVK